LIKQLSGMHFSVQGNQSGFDQNPQAGGNESLVELEIEGISVMPTPD
jgi:hypothetical protein